MSLIKKLTWQEGNNFDDNTLSFVNDYTTQVVDTIAFYGPGYIVSSGESGKYAEIHLFNPDTQEWTVLPKIYTSDSNKRTVGGEDYKLDFDNLSLTFPPQKVSKIRLTGDYAGQLYKSFDGTTIELALSEPVIVPLNQQIELIATAELSATTKRIDIIQAEISSETSFVFSGKLTSVKNLNKTSLINESIFKVSKPSKISIARSNVIIGSGLLTRKNIQRVRSIQTIIQGSSKFETTLADRPINQIMMDYLPKYYNSSKMVGSIIDTEAIELIKLSEATKDVLDQFFIDTATWGLSRWEKICNIETNNNLSYEERRDQIKQRVIGYETLTKAYLKKQFELFYKVKIDEDPRNYQVIITITQMRAVPESLKFFNELLKLILHLIPAHLRPVIKFLWAPWDELKSADIRWGDLSGISSWNAVKTQYYKEPSHKMEESISWGEAESIGLKLDDFGTQWTKVNNEWKKFINENISFNSFSKSWDDLHSYDPVDSYKDMRDFSWEEMDKQTWNTFDSKITNKWEVKI